MLLVSYSFAAFLAVLLLGCFLVPERFRWLFLLLFSLLFSVAGGPQHLVYPLVTALSTWYLGKRIDRIGREAKAYLKTQNFDRAQKKEYNRSVKKRQKRYLILGLVLNFGILAAIKYTPFFYEICNGLLGIFGLSFGFSLPGWTLPLGISYYTFQTMGYLVDVYNKTEEAEENPAKLGLFTLYFPQLTAGPVSRFGALKETLFSPEPMSFLRFKRAGFRILWGYFKKLVIADRLGPAVLVITQDPQTYHGIYGLLGILGYTLWMYADFSGCIDIVLGISEAIGIRLPENFDRPFASKSLAELWRRWHMTLMQWFREYIFFPVSTSNLAKRLSNGLSKRLSREVGNRVPLYLGSLTVWLVTGIWHGASWNYVSWGLANCVVMLASQELAGVFKSARSRFGFTKTKAYGYFECIRTCLLFAVLLMFQYYPFPVVFAMLIDVAAGSRISDLFDGRFAGLGLAAGDLWILALGLVLLVISGLRKESIQDLLLKKHWLIQYLAAFGLFLLILLFGVYGHGYDASQFIYNQF